jgi:hypothetical protein
MSPPNDTLFELTSGITSWVQPKPKVVWPDAYPYHKRSSHDRILQYQADCCPRSQPPQLKHVCYPARATSFCKEKLQRRRRYVANAFRAITLAKIAKVPNTGNSGWEGALGR